MVTKHTSKAKLHHMLQNIRQWPCRINSTKAKCELRMVWEDSLMTFITLSLIQLLNTATVEPYTVIAH